MTGGLREGVVGTTLCHVDNAWGSTHCHVEPSTRCPDELSGLLGQDNEVDSEAKRGKQFTICGMLLLPYMSRWLYASPFKLRRCVY